MFSYETRVVEGEKVPVVVELSQGRSEETDVVVSVRHIDTDATDFDRPRITVTIPAGKHKRVGYGEFPTFGDTSLEEDEKFQLYISSADVTVDESKAMNGTLIDNDQNADLIVKSSTPTPFSYDEALALVEGGGGGFSVRLASPPSGNVTVTISEESDPGNKIEFKGGAQQTTLTFTRNKSQNRMKETIWHEPQTVSVWARQDDDTEGHNRYLSITPSGGGYIPQLHSERLRVSVNDDDDDDGSNSPTNPVKVPDTPVTNVQASVIDDESASVTWDAVEHATSYQVEWEGNGQTFSSAGALPGVTDTTATIYHQAQEAMTLAIEVIPAYVDGDGDTQLLDDLAGTTTLDVAPAGDGQSDAPPSACVVSDAQWNTVEGYYASNSGKAPNYGRNWYRVLIAYGQERTDETLPAWVGVTARPTTPYTVAEAQTSETAWSGWTPVREVLECVEAANPPPPAPLQASDPELSLSAGAAVDEGDGATFTVHADPAPQSDLTVRFTVAQSGDWLDAPGAGSRTVTLPAGAASADLTVATVDDGTDEPDGAVSVTVDAGSGYTVAASPDDTASVDVADDDTAAGPYAALIAKMVEWRNDPKWASYKTHTDRWDRALLAFGETVADSTLTPMTAAEAQAFADRGWTRWVEVATALSEIESNEEDETSDVVADPVAAVEPELRLAAGPAVDEGGNAEFTITANPAPEADLTVEYTVAQSGEVLSAPAPASRTVTLAAGAASTTLTLATADDDTNEPDGSVGVTLEAGTDYTVAAGQASGTVTVRDNDQPVVSLTAGTGVTEGDPASFTVTADPAPAAPVTVTLTVDQSGDYAGATGSREVVVPTEGHVTVDVATDDDDADEPDGSISATLTAGSGYTVAASPDDTATVTVADNDVATVAGVPALSVDDAEAHESEGRLPVVIRLSPPSKSKVTVWAKTRESNPVSARAGVDYRVWNARWGIRIDFRPGETERQLAVAMINDSHDEDAETFEVVLSDPSGSAMIADGVGVMTIVNSDPMPKAWLSRFGRTVTQQALDGITGRLAAPRTPGAQGTLAGQSFTLRPRGATGAAPDTAASETPLLAGLAALVLPDLATGGTGTGAQGGFDDVEPGRPGANGLPARTLTLRDVLLGSSFSATGQPDAHGGSFAFWGRAAQANFEGREGTFALDGETTTAMLGTDYARDRWLVGVSLLQSTGTGGYDDPDNTPAAACADLTEAMREVLCGGAVREGAGSVESTLTAAVPYAAFQASERLKLWGAAGYGAGEVTLTPETGGTLKTDMSWSMAELGLRGQVLAPAESGPALAVTSDALWTRTTSEKVQGGLAASESDVTRLRLGLEGSWLVRLDTLGQLTPKLAVGARHDGGDAETGFGVELGGGVAWTAPRFGLALNLEGRTLLTHRDEDFQDQGVAASFAFDPDPATPRGPSLTVRQDWGGQATGGVDALFAADPLTQRQGTTATSSRWAAEAAWGFPAFGGRFTGSPHMGVGLASGTRDYSLGWRLVPATPALALSLDLQATRRELDAAQPEHRVGLEITTQW